MASQDVSKKQKRSFLERLGVKQKIENKKAQIDYAISIDLAPVGFRINVDTDFVRFVKGRLVDRPVVKGDTTSSISAFSLLFPQY